MCDVITLMGCHLEVKSMDVSDVMSHGVANVL